jgi:hypothetical protein
MNANGSLIIDDGNYAGTITNNIVVLGNYTQSNGTLNLSNNSSSAITASTRRTLFDVYGNFSHTGGTISETAFDVDMITQINLLGTTSKTFTTTGQTGQVEIILNKTGATNGVNNVMTLTADSKIDYLLTLTKGLMTLTTYNLTLGSTATLTYPGNTNAMIVPEGTGELRKPFSANGSFVFPVGDNTGTVEYSPITVAVTGTAYSSAYIGVSLGDAKHPNNYSATDFLTRYWNVSQSGITTCSATITGTYISGASDVSGTSTNISPAWLNGTFDQLSNPWVVSGSALGSTLTYTASSTAGNISVFT